MNDDWRIGGYIERIRNEFNFALNTNEERERAAETGCPLNHVMEPLPKAGDPWQPCGREGREGWFKLLTP